MGRTSDGALPQTHQRPAAGSRPPEGQAFDVWYFKDCIENLSVCYRSQQAWNV